VRLEGGRAAACQEYPEAFCRAIVEGLKREIADETWIKTVYESLDPTDTIETLMSLCKEPEHAVPPEESLEMAEYMAIYSDLEFVDDVTGVKLDKKEAVKARKTEMEYFKSRGVYDKMPKEPGMKVISTRWLDVNKGDEVKRDYRARLVGRELNLEKRNDLFAATPAWNRSGRSSPPSARSAATSS